MRKVTRAGARNAPSHNVRGRHHARRNVVPPGRRHIAVSVQLRTNSVPNGERRLWFHKVPRKKGSLETLVSSGFLVTFSAAKKSLRPQAETTPRPQARNTPSHNVRGRHPARRNVAPPGRRHIAPSVQLRINSVPNGERRLWLHKMPREKRKP